MDRERRERPVNTSKKQNNTIQGNTSRSESVDPSSRTELTSEAVTDLNTVTLSETEVAEDAATDPSCNEPHQSGMPSIPEDAGDTQKKDSTEQSDKPESKSSRKEKAADESANKTGDSTQGNNLSTVDNETLCSMVHDLLPLYVDGLVSSATVSIIERHAEKCDKCSSTLKALQEPEPEKLEDLPDLPVRNALEKTGDTIRKSRRTAGLLVILCLVLCIGVVALFFQGANLNADDVLVSGQSQKNGETAVLVLKSTNPDIGFLNYKTSYDKQTGICDLTVYGGSGLLDRKQQCEVEIPLSAKEVRINGNLIYMDGETITSMCRYYAQWINGYPGSVQQMQLSRPNFTVNNQPVSVPIDATEDPNSRIWVWKMEDTGLKNLSESQLNAWKQTALIVLALTPELQEIRLQDQYGENLIIYKEDLFSYLEPDQMTNGFDTEADLQRFLNRLNANAG